MKTLALLARKGGAGKTTLAVHLAVIAAQSGKRTLLVDTDPQRSTAAWWRSRPAEMPELVECEASRLPMVLEAAAADGIELAVVDTRPSVEADTGLVARLADLVLIPTRPAILDLRAIAETARVVRAAGSPTAIVLNAVPPSRGAIESAVTTEARNALAAYELPVCRVAITSRAALSHALAGGLAVSEFDPTGKAAANLKDLFIFAKDVLWPNARQSRSKP